ncbi:unnamed protein product [Staurois parvus]|uniref:Uncharacterized protein n=1 Tax=Staurois parvus TaxID=386267 RepID=A0ABN9FY65_9NEOB|nr:unnamed protein product [Staurois parvus]
MGPLCPCPNSKKTYEKVTKSISWGSLLTRALGQCPSFQMVSPPLILYTCKALCKLTALYKYLK